MKKMFQPLIKWSGSKRSQASEIIKYFPKEIDTYYEPFCGGCSVLRTLLESNIKVNRYICSDLNTELIELWRLIKSNPISGNVDNTYEVPSDLYSQHLYIKSRNSSFKRAIGKSNDSIVYESLYIKK